MGAVQGADIYTISSLSLDKHHRLEAPLINSSTVHPISASPRLKGSSSLPVHET